MSIEMYGWEPTFELLVNIEMSVEMYRWEPTFELLVIPRLKFVCPKVTSIIDRGMVPVIFHVCIGLLELEASSTP